MRKLALAVSFLMMTLAAHAGLTGTYTTGGSTTGTGPWTMTSTDSTFSVLRFVLDNPIQFQDLTSVVVGYNAVQGGIGGGAPRLAVVLDTLDSFLIHWGPAGSFVDPTLGPGSTGNLLSLTDVGRYDLGGVGGSAYTDRAAALSLVGTQNVIRLFLILDSFGGNDRTFVIDGITAEGREDVPEPATLSLLGASLLGLGIWRRRTRG